MGYVRSPFTDFESYLRIVVDLDDEDIRLISKQYNSHFITYELSCPGIYTIQDISDAVRTFSGHGGRLQIEYDDINMKKKLLWLDMVRFLRRWDLMKNRFLILC